MDLKEYYREEIRRRKLEGDQGDGVSLAQLEAEFAKLLESERSSSDTEHSSSSEHRAGNIAPKLTLDSTQPEEDIPEFVREEQPYYAIDGYPYDDFFGAIEGGMRGASRHGKIGVDRSGKVYARDGISELDKRLVELKWEYEQAPERRDEIAAEAARLRAQHEGEYTVTEEMPLSQFQLLESDFLKELQSGPPALEPPPVPEEEIAAALDEEFSDGPEFHNAPRGSVPLSATDDPVILAGRKEGERLLSEIYEQYTVKNPSELDKVYSHPFSYYTESENQKRLLEQVKNDPELHLALLDLIPDAYVALSSGDPTVFTNSSALNLFGTVAQQTLESSIQSGGQPGIASTLFSQKNKKISEAQEKLDLALDGDIYQNLINPYWERFPKSITTAFQARLKEKIEDIKKNTPQTYDDPEKDKKYREALLEPLYRVLWINESSDYLLDKLQKQYELIENKY